MSSIAVRVKDLSKHYFIDTRKEYHDTFRDHIVHGLRDFLTRKVKGESGGVNPTATVATGNQPSSNTSIWALKDMSFEIHQGEVVGFVGRNGAGKSTLLKILSRITEPTTGRVELHGRVGSLLEVGTGFHPELSGRENVYLNGAIIGMRKLEIDRKFDEIVAFAEVEKFIDTPVKRYSSGMYVRLAFAVAAHLETEVLIVDEVLAVGDEQFQKKCLGKMGDVAKEGRTVLFVSHNKLAVRTLCSRGLVMIDGRLHCDASAVDALEEYSRFWTSAGIGRFWQRVESIVPIDGIGFHSIEVEVSGKQPALSLNCRVELRATHRVPDVFIAVDVCDQLQTPIMQAVPIPKPFIPGHPGVHQLALQIDLPPLVPGSYYLDFWIGPHYAQTTECIKKAVVIEIAESPCPDRVYPHTVDHGFMVPQSRCTYVSG